MISRVNWLTWRYELIDRDDPEWGWDAVRAKVGKTLRRAERQEIDSDRVEIEIEWLL